MELRDRAAELVECLEIHNVQDAWKIAGLWPSQANPAKMEALRSCPVTKSAATHCGGVAAVVDIFWSHPRNDNSTAHQ